MSPAGSRGARKAARDVFQSVLAVVAAGGTAALIDLIAGSVSPAVGVVLVVIYKILVTYAQNYLETRGTVPAMLPSPGLVTASDSNKVVAVVEPVVEATGNVVGKVTNTAGGLVGTLTGEIL